MLDRLTAEQRHLALLLIGAALAWLSTELPGLDVDPLSASLIGALATAALAYLTPLTKQYGVGKTDKID
ncbi:hypothetical protein UFOVP1504_13 [uncultured Caudovirales phage]|uniref:Uncharacterized protein n=1 Tax=uncultured Caudovirales phage TaxID=2100421 RepID=A0A6J5SPN9_9CAUD|nr:hypothetical protein UFOVP1143_19 [uncultured Caudovirales phage]CAB4217086.1 hypothetical protein UFOVP1504_13 [uncultured Caudovirales phage]